VTAADLLAAPTEGTITYAGLVENVDVCLEVSVTGAVYLCTPARMHLGSGFAAAALCVCHDGHGMNPPPPPTESLQAAQSSN
jgi:hypothetical protein